MSAIGSIITRGGLGGLVESRSVYGGVVAAAITPCSSPGRPDPVAMERLCCVLSGIGKCNGVFVLGSTGELPLLDEDDRRSLVVAASRGISKEAILYAGVSGTGVNQVCRYACNAANDGADVAVVMAPFFLKLSDAELATFFQLIADTSPIPIALYHHLRMTTPIGIEVIKKLSSHPNIIGMKETSNDPSRYQGLVDVSGTCNLRLFQGSEKHLLESVRLGFSGFVTALAGIVPQWHIDLLDSYNRGDLKEAQALQSRIINLAKLFQLDYIATSFAHFAYALRRASKAAGLIDNLDGMVPGFEPEDDFIRAIDGCLLSAGLPLNWGIKGCARE